MAHIILEDNYDLINSVLKDCDELSTAEFENKVIQIALENFWNKT